MEIANGRYVLLFRFNQTGALSRRKHPEMPCLLSCTPHFVVQTLEGTHRQCNTQVAFREHRAHIRYFGADGATVTRPLSDRSHSGLRRKTALTAIAVPATAESTTVARSAAKFHWVATLATCHEGVYARERQEGPSNLIAASVMDAASARSSVPIPR
jgi:hypothetical protein